MLTQPLHRLLMALNVELTMECTRPPNLKPWCRACAGGDIVEVLERAWALVKPLHWPLAVLYVG